MCRIAYADDAWTVLSERDPVARKEHRCDDCCRTIEPGERYHHIVAKGDYLNMVKICAQCMAAGEWLMHVCNGWIWGQIGDELAEHWGEEYPLRSLGLGRLVVAHRHMWRNRAGVLYPAPAVRVWAQAGVRVARGRGA